MKGGEIAASQIPANIKIELSPNSSLAIGNDDEPDEKVARTFTFIGTQQGTNVPVYLESLDQDGYVVPQPLPLETNDEQTETGPGE